MYSDSIDDTKYGGIGFTEFTESRFKRHGDWSMKSMETVIHLKVSPF